MANDWAGNAEIVQQGAQWASEDVASIDVPRFIDTGQLGPQPRDAADLFETANRLGLKTTQLNEWLKRAVSEKKIKKLNRPVRYQWQDGDAQQTMF